MKAQLRLLTAAVAAAPLVAHAAGVMPAIATDPQGDKAIRLEVGTVLGDMSWIWLPFESALDTGQHPVVTVSFDVYRYDYAGSSSATNWNHNLFWAWTDENDEALVPTTEPGFPKPSSPTWGAQWDVSAETYPFGWYAPYDALTAGTAFGRYANVTLIWDFAGGKASASYDGKAVATDVPIDVPLGGLLMGWDITLHHGADTGYGPDVVWIDNFVISGSDIYNAQGFDQFTEGAGERAGRLARGDRAPRRGARARDRRAARPGPGGPGPGSPAPLSGCRGRDSGPGGRRRLPGPRRLARSTSISRGVAEIGGFVPSRPRNGRRLRARRRPLRVRVSAPPPAQRLPPGGAGEFPQSGAFSARGSISAAENPGRGGRVTVLFDEFLITCERSSPGSAAAAGRSMPSG